MALRQPGDGGAVGDDAVAVVADTPMLPRGRADAAPDVATVYTHTGYTHTGVADEQLILVDAADREIGYLGKGACHTGAGRLHRAFSIFIFNERDEVLLQQRSVHKPLWPLYWSNSCCSHPRRGETLAVAARRRLREELGLACTLRFLFKFEYQAQYAEAAAEHELCSVFVGRSTAPVHVDRAEIADWRWVRTGFLQRQLAGAGAARYTPWMRLEWARLWDEHRHDLLAGDGHP